MSSDKPYELDLPSTFHIWEPGVFQDNVGPGGFQRCAECGAIGVRDNPTGKAGRGSTTSSMNCTSRNHTRIFSSYGRQRLEIAGLDTSKYKFDD